MNVNLYNDNNALFVYKVFEHASFSCLNKAISKYSCTEIISPLLIEQRGIINRTDTFVSIQFN